MVETKALYGPWDYRKAIAPYPYDDTTTYQIAGEWVSNRGLVEDWGCGTAWMRQYVRGGPYRGIDGAWSRFCNQVVDLRSYTSTVPCAVMRHVLEHNWDWRQIAANFSRSWTDRAAVVLFIPPQLDDVVLSQPDWPVPDIAISGPDLIELMSPATFEFVQIFYPPDNTIQWGWEGVLLMER